MNIQLVTMTLDEVERTTRAPAAAELRELDIISGSMPPDFVLNAVLERHRQGEDWFWCAPRLLLLAAESLIVGSIGFKNSPREGAVEIGFGVANSYQGRGCALEGVRLMVSAGFSKPEVSAITAETAVWNVASQRVLEKAGFLKAGTRVDANDGPLILWGLERPRA